MTSESNECCVTIKAPCGQAPIFRRGKKTRQRAAGEEDTVFLTKVCVLLLVVVGEEGGSGWELPREENETNTTQRAI